MDAVFAPNMITNPSIFRQEGWHYEYDEQADRLSLNGVVYNEMKGAYSSPDELGGVALNRALFDGTPYRYDSGGNPDCIPDLTYEKFKATHEKYYHPSSAKIVLDGRMDLDKILPLISSHLDGYERREKTTLHGKSEKKIIPTRTISYEISENESEKGKARVLYGFVYSDYADREAQLVVSILSDLLCGSNVSPLKKALLDRGLAKDAAMYAVKSREQTVVIEVRDADEERIDEIDKTVEEVIRGLSSDGIDKDMLSSTLSHIEFRMKERDFGNFPAGIAFAMSMYGSWMNGGLPEDALLFDDLLCSVKSKLDGRFFEEELLKITLDNSHRAKIVMLPDKTLGERNAAAEAERLKKILLSMTEEELSQIKKEEADLRQWQNTDESEAAMECLPGLLLSDIPTKTDRPTVKESELCGAKILKCSTKTNGIVYISMLFDASDLSGEELAIMSMLSSALTNFPTESADTLALQNDIKSNLGSFFTSFAVGTKNGVTTPYFKVGASALTSKADDLIRITREVLFTSKIDSQREMTDILMQVKSNLESAMIASGESFALSRAEASISESGAVGEYLSGYEAYAYLSKICSDERSLGEITGRVSALLKKLTDRRRLTIFITGELDECDLACLVSLFPVGDGEITRKRTPLCAEKYEFILIPSKVAYAVIGGRSERVREKLGFMRVARSILSYEYLWSTVRVQSGAYGTGFIPRKDGSIAFYSYRDPSPAKSLEFYRESSAYLREMAESGADISKFIIGAIGEYDMIITPRSASALIVNDYIGGWSAEDDVAIREQMLSMTASDLNTVADVIDEAISQESIAIVGGSEHLASLDVKPTRVIKI